LSTYFAGSIEMWDIEREVRDARPRVGRSTRRRPRTRTGVVGGFGETAGFVYRRHLESVIAHGSPPTVAPSADLLARARRYDPERGRALQPRQP